MGEREEHSRVELADAGTLLGMLQRGRGQGYLVALETPPQEVWPLLFECITNDPRVDQQCEPRAEYYASLILRIGMNLEPLQSYVRQNDNPWDSDGWATVLALETLESLAKRGSRPAVEILRDYLQYGADWVWVTEILDDLAMPGAMEGVGEVLCDRISGDPDLYEQLQDQIEEDWAEYCRADEETRQRWPFLLPMSEPWKSLCERNDGLAQLFSRNRLPYDPPPAVPKVTDADVEGLSVEDLLASVDKASFYPSKRAIIRKVSVEDEDRLLESLSSDDEYVVMLAFCGLGELGTTRAFKAVRSYIEGSEDVYTRVRAAAFDAIAEMPGSRTLETARQWFLRDEWHLHRTAGGILMHHATLEDIPLLMQALRTPEILREQGYRLTCILRALARFERLGRIPEVEQIFCQTGDSFSRGNAAEAMATTSPDLFTAEHAYECLWDCGWRAFRVSCAIVDLSTPGAVARLREIIADPHESEERREIAKERLETAG